MNVPNQYKGFSRLPESVQQKMDPSLAQRYQMGGQVMQRPLFRQAGGPAQPMPQDIMPPAPPDPMSGQMNPQAQQLMAAEQNMAGQMEQVGREYAGQMMAGLDAADDMKGVIDALRGNDKPLQSRYNELADLVGPEDAQATPESVLALVQPTIMMTEQGAVDSGIGQLMQGIASNVEMQTPGGEPTPMAGGVGALMAQGAGNTPPVNFSQGGPVRLQGGGDPTLESLYQQMLPTYQSIMGDPEQQKQAAQSQALFAISDAAGRFAAGQGAGGQDLRGLSPAAQLAGATTGLGAQLGALGAANQQQEQAMKLAALQGAQGEYSAITAARRASKAKGSQMVTLFNKNDLSLPPMVLDKNSPTYAVDYAAAVGNNFIDTKEIGALRDLQNPNSKLITLFKDDQVVTFDIANPEQKALYDARLAEGSWVADPTQYTALVQAKKEKEVSEFKADRAVADQIKTELRQRGYKLEDRDLNLLEEIAREERLNGYTLKTEERQAALEGKRFERDQGAAIEQELRQRGFKLEDRDLNLLEEIAREERLNGYTLKTEERQAALEGKRFERDQAATIEQELRQRGFKLEDRDLDLVAEIAREGRAFDRTLSGEQRQTLLEQKRFERDQAAKIATELRGRDFALQDRDLDLLAEIAREERALGRTLKTEERQALLEQKRFERDQGALLTREERAEARALAAEQRAEDQTIGSEARALARQIAKEAREEQKTIRAELRGDTRKKDAEKRALLTQIAKEGRALSAAPVKGIPAEIFNGLSAEQQQRVLLGNPKDPQTVKGVPRDIFDSLSAEQQQNLIVGDQSQEKTAGERLRAAISNQDTYDRLSAGTLGASETSRLFADLETYISPQIGPSGISTLGGQLPVPAQNALKKIYEAGGTLPAWFDPTMVGLPPEPGQIDGLSQSLIDPNVRLEAGTGLVSGLARAINYVGEMTFGELPGVDGTVFTGTTEAQQALGALNSATRRFNLEGRQLATELDLSLKELPKAAFTSTDKELKSNVKTQRALLADFIQRTELALKNKSLTETSTSAANAQLAFAKQLKLAYDAAATNLGINEELGSAGANPADFRR